MKKYLLIYLIFSALTHLAQVSTKDKIADGLAFFNSGDLIHATAHFEQLYKSTPNHSEITYWLGRCYELKDDKRKAAELYLSAFKKSKYAAPDILYRVGRAFQLKSNFLDATKYYNLYLKQMDSVKALKMGSTLKYEKYRTSKMLKECENLKKHTARPYKHKITNMGKLINTPYEEYTPLISLDNQTLIFTSRRPGGMSDEKDMDGSYFEDIWMSKKNAKGIWLAPVNLGKPINSNQHDACVALSPDGNLLFVYKSTNGGDIYLSELQNGEWSHPKNLSKNINTDAQEASLAITADNKTIYFSSNRSGGQGGLDLYKSTQSADGEWNTPENLGTDINTEFEEDAPFITHDGKTLYFSSSGHDNMGGYDIYKSTYNEGLGKWSKPQNMGVPVNSPEDDIFIVLTKDQKTAYFASGRMGGLGSKDIFLINIDATFVNLKPVYKKDPKAPLIPTSLTGFVMFTGKVISDKQETLESVIKIKNLLSPDKAEEIPTDKDGYFNIPLKSGADYAINIEKSGFLFQSINLNLTKPLTTKEFKLDVKLSKPVEGQKIVLKNVFYEKGKTTLSPKSFHEIDALVQFLQINTNLKIEISGHTDNYGTPAVNKKISTDRAKSVYDYLVKKGIPADKLKYAGYGSEKPIANNKTEYGRQKNRRTEFEIIDVL
ncbi:MAG: OmpA family protein [Cytophagales bacterium]|nr:OmpA family protein [Cytophagales bacterium]